MRDKFEEVDVADFSEMLNDDEEVPIDDSVDVGELLEDKNKYKVKILGYWGEHQLPIIIQREYLICCIGSKHNLLLVNTHYEDFSHHSHLRLKTNKQGEIVLSTVDYVFDCVLKHKYPKSNYTWVCTLRLLDDDDVFKEFMIRKKDQQKQKQKYINTHKKKK